MNKAKQSSFAAHAPKTSTEIPAATVKTYGTWSAVWSTREFILLHAGRGTCVIKAVPQLQTFAYTGPKTGGYPREIKYWIDSFMRSVAIRHGYKAMIDHTAYLNTSPNQRYRDALAEPSRRGF